MRYMTFLLLALVWAGPCLAASADENAKWRETVLQLENHPEVAAYTSAAAAATAYAAGERGLPDPMIFIENRNISGMNEEKMLGFSQPFPAAGARDAAAAGYLAEAEKTRLMAGFARAALKARLITTLANLDKITALEKITRKRKVLLALAEKSARGRVAANLGTVADAALLRAQSIEADMMLADLSEERHELHNMLIYITGSGDAIKAPEAQLAMWDGDVGQSWPVMIAEAEKKKSETDVHLQESGFRPAFAVEGGASRMRGGENTGTLRLSVSVPLWAAGNQMPKLRGAAAALAASDSETQKTRREMQEKLAHLQTQISVSHRKTELLRRRISEMESAAAARKRSYAAGKTDLSEVIAARLAALAARADLENETARQTGLIAEFNRYIAGEDHE